MRASSPAGSARPTTTARSSCSRRPRGSTCASTRAQALAGAGGDGDGVEATICARDFEIHVDLVVEPGAEAQADELEARLLPPVERYLFARDERPVEELVLALLRARGLSLATAESCTGGRVASRLTSVPGASDVFLVCVVSYSDG